MTTQAQPNVTPLPKAPRFKLHKAHEYAAKAGKETPYLVRGLLPRVGVSVVWGPPKSGKSFWTLDLVAHVALGMRYRDRKVQAGAVVYCVLEGQAGFPSRLEAVMEQLVGGSDDPEWQQFPLYLMDQGLTLQTDQKELVQSIRVMLSPDDLPACVVLDTLNRSIDGDDSSNRDMTTYVSAAAAISSAFECAVIIVHHCGWNETRMRGASALAGNSDCQIAITKRGDVVKAELVAAKDIEEGLVVLSKLVQVQVGKDSEGEPLTTCVVEPAAGSCLTKGWPKGLATFRAALDAAFEDQAQDYQPQREHVIKIVPVDAVHAEFGKRYVYKGKGNQAEAQGRQWRRHLADAHSADLIGRDHVNGQDVLWLK